MTLNPRLSADSPGPHVRVAVQADSSANVYVFWVAVIAALGGLLFGYDTGIIASALPEIAARFHLTTDGQQFVASSILVGCIVGALSSGRVSDRLGRRKTLAAVGALFILAAIAAALSVSAPMLIACRFFLGISVGGASQVVPIYIAELAPAKRRGTLVVAFQLAVIAGILVSSVSGYFLGSHAGGWRLTTGLGSVPAALLLLGMLTLPETPRWLLLRGRRDQARAVLARVRGAGSDVQGEIAEIERVEAGHATGSWREVWSPRIRPALICAAGIALLCQITGINAVIYYAPTILNNAGFNTSRSLLVSMSVNIVLFIFTVLGFFLVDIWGRRRLLLWWTPLSVVSLAVLGASFSGSRTIGPSWLVVVGLMAYQAFNGGGLSVVAWLIASEVFPLGVRGKAMSIAAMVVWLADLLVSLNTLSLVSALGARTTFWMFGGISVLACLFIFYRVPETRGRSLEAIETSLNTGTFLPQTRRGR